VGVRGYKFNCVNKGIEQIGRELAVDYIVEGEVRRDGSRVR